VVKLQEKYRVIINMEKKRIGFICDDWMSG
jgi:hypothetical protein